MDIDRLVLFVNTSIDLTSSFKNKNFKILIADSGAEALKLLSSSSPQIQTLVVNDTLPDMLVIEFIKKVQHNSVLKNIPLILISEKTMEQQFEEVIGLEIYDIIFPPFDARLLNGSILRALKNYKQTELSLHDQ